METVNFLLDRPVVLLIVLLIGGVIGIALDSALNRVERERRRAYWRGRNHAGAKWRAVGPNSPRVAPLDAAAEQLKAVMKARFSSRPLLNRSEAKVFDALDKAVIARNPGWQVMAQVSLGEFLASPDKDAFLAVNSKRVDFALMDANACVVHALEYQGNGHHQGSAAARDAVKKEALRKAGIGYHESSPDIPRRPS